MMQTGSSKRPLIAPRKPPPPTETTILLQTILNESKRQNLKKSPKIHVPKITPLLHKKQKQLYNPKLIKPKPGTNTNTNFISKLTTRKPVQIQAYNNNGAGGGALSIDDVFQNLPAKLPSQKRRKKRRSTDNNNVKKQINHDNNNSVSDKLQHARKLSIEIDTSRRARISSNAMNASTVEKVAASGGNVPKHSSSSPVKHHQCINAKDKGGGVLSSSSSVMVKSQSCLSTVFHKKRRAAGRKSVLGGTSIPSSNKTTTDQYVLASASMNDNAITTADDGINYHRVGAPPVAAAAVVGMQQKIPTVARSSSNSMPSNSISILSAVGSYKCEEMAALTTTSGGAEPHKHTNKKKNNRKKRKESAVAHANNDNFVALNLKNSAGSCRGAGGARARKRAFRMRHQQRRGYSYSDEHYKKNNNGVGAEENKERTASFQARSKLRVMAEAGVDALDDYMDGAFDETVVDGKKNDDIVGYCGAHQQQPRKAPRKQGNRTKGGDDKTPICARHTRPCKLIKVKKSGPNKGRKFYACSMPRGEQCDFFQWADDTAEAAKRALLSSSSQSGFVARQVDAYASRFKVLTLPELRVEAKKRGLRHIGKKAEVLARLMVWVRDEIAGDEEGYHEEDSTALELSKESLPASVSKPTRDTVVSLGDNNDALEETGDLESECTSSGVEEDDDSADELEFCDAANGNSPSASGGMSSWDNGKSCQSTAVGEEHPIQNSACSDDEESKSSNSDDVTDKEVSSFLSPNYLLDALESNFKFTSFRPGQEWAVNRCIDGQRSLLVAATGTGKSLCYALPAALLDGLTIVVSPLISLIQDQLRSLPPKIPAATLSGSMSITKMATVVDDIIRGRLKLLFVSPERLVSASFRRLIRGQYDKATGTRIKKLPPVSLFCVDEAHCLSQWGHNFRPSYLRLKSILPLIKPKSVLALTATAGPKVIDDICRTLSIPYNKTDATETESGVRILDFSRDNILVSAQAFVSEDRRRTMLMKMLKPPGKINSDMINRPKTEIMRHGALQIGSIIIYVWRKRDAEALAEQIIGAGVEGGVVFYHGGMDSGKRAVAQGKFMRGKVRICVATVAFGLGIDKPDVYAVVHMCIPQSPEHYLQEIGRAGRDGRNAFAYALLLTEEATIRHSLSHSDGMTLSQVKALTLYIRAVVDQALEDSVAVSIVEGDGKKNLASVDIALGIPSIVEAIDAKEESLETIISLLEETQMGSLLSFEGTLPNDGTITLKKRDISKLVAMEPIMRAIERCGVQLEAGELPTQQNMQQYGGTAMEKGFHAYSFGSWKFSIIRCAQFVGPLAEPRHVFAALRRLQNSGEIEFTLDTGPRGKAFHLRMTQAGIDCFQTRKLNNVEDTSTNDASLSKVTEKVMCRLGIQEKVAVKKVEQIHTILHRVASFCAKRLGVHADNGNEIEITKSPSDFFYELTSHALYNEESSLPSTVDDDENVDNVPCINEEFSNSKMATQLWVDACVLLRDATLIQKRPPPAVNVIPSPSNALPENTDYTVRCVVKILHGIESPRASIANGWNQHMLWGKWRNFCFSVLCNRLREFMVRHSFANA